MNKYELKKGDKLQKVINGEKKDLKVKEVKEVSGGAKLIVFEEVPNNG